MVYTPPDYYSNPTKRYPLLVYLHGLSGNIDQNTLHFQYFVDQQVNAGAFNGFIILHPDGRASSILANPKNEPKSGTRWYDSAFYGHIAEYVCSDLIGFVDANYRTKAEKRYRGVTGWSMGGDGSQHLFMAHDVFGSFYAMSARMDKEQSFGKGAVGHVTFFD